MDFVTHKCQGGRQNKKIMPQMDFYFLSQASKCWVCWNKKIKNTNGKFNELKSSSISQTMHMCIFVSLKKSYAQITFECI